MINLQISEQYNKLVSADVLKQAAQETLTQAGTPIGVELTIVLENNEVIQALNNQFRQIDSPTDVLSFPSGDMENPENDLTYLGDIVISVPKAQDQATTAGHSLQAELQLLTIHGVLHLIGFDHADEDQKTAMWLVQAEILEAVGAEINTPPED
jgi:probable rRNA maturation factor